MLHTSLLPRCGVAYDSYELSDIVDPRVGDYSVYVLPNAFSLSDDEKAAITRLEKPWGQAPGVGFEMMAISTFLARCGVGGGASRRMPKGALISGFEKPLPSARPPRRDRRKRFLGAESWLFESQGATGESGKVR